MTGPVYFAVFFMTMVFFYALIVFSLTMLFAWAWFDGFDDGYRVGRASMERIENENTSGV